MAKAPKNAAITPVDDTIENLPAIPEGGTENTTPEQKKALIDNYIRIAGEKTALEKKLEQVNTLRSDAVKALYLACGKKVFKISGKLVTIEKRKDTFFLKEMNVELDETATG